MALIWTTLMQWDNCEDRIAVIGLGFTAVIAFWASLNLVANWCEKFLEFAFTQGKGNQVVPCPCVKCNNERRKTRPEIELDLLKFGIVKSYTRWVRHDESFECQVDANDLDDSHQNVEHNYMSDMLYEAFGMATQEVDAEVGEAVDAKAKVGIRGDPSEEAKTFYKLMEDLELPLYPGCKNFSKLSFLLKLFHIKCLGGITDKSLSMILDLFKEALPDNNTLPESFYEAQKTVKKLSLNSIKIDACPNNCMLFWKEHANADECPKGPKKNIDVYLQPLIEELKLLWHVGVETTGGEKSCPTCNSDTSSEWLRNGGKYCYMCHRRFLPIDHEWRYDGASFDGTHEIRPKPKELTGEEVLEQLVDVECVTSFETPTRKRNRRKDQKNKCKAIWRKKSIFYELRIGVVF
ncbi:uncharacterized protein LOC125492859 [Beta vulgaris subsp. vulgaris]|uniref:uncharacterized protein LOC125492859 n=1 Tax=Beta vulgaris subsp. vulgaris TaxID=3555 RepID=UPI0025494005|nr:uncharacterized protein LOC125492859 [Beta vulgaris subsp. vulgaris]